jgi:hypothetical protein
MVGGGSSSSCDLSAPYTDFQGAGGTSFASPTFAGIIAMVNQKTRQRQGNANYVLYPLAKQPGASCASNTSAVGNSSCIFYDIQAGNNSVACYGGTLNCSNTSQASGQFGILVNPSNTAQPAWPTSPGYDLATGLGSVNVANLVNNWTSVSFAPTTTTLSISPTTITHGQSVTLNVSVTSASGTPTGDVGLLGGPNNSNLGISYVTLGSNGTISEPTKLLPGGTYGVTARYEGNGTFGSSTSSPAVQVTVNPESSKTVVQVVTFDCNNNYTYGVTSLPYGYNIACTSSGSTFVEPAYFLRMDVENSSGTFCSVPTGNPPYPVPSYQCPTGQVAVTDNGASLKDLGAPTSPGAYTLNSQGTAEDVFIQLPGGSNALVATYTPVPGTPNSSYASSQGTATINVTPASTTTTLSSSATTVSASTSVILTATVSTMSMGFAPSGTVQFINNGLPITGTVNYSPPTNGSASGYASYTATLTTSFSANASVTAQYSGDTNYVTSTSAAVAITFSGGTPDFSWTSPTTLNIASPGDSGSESLSASALNGFTGTIGVTCAIPSGMTGATCSLVATSFTVPGSTMLTVNTVAPSTALRLFNRPRWFMPSAGALFACILLLLLIPGKKRRAKLAFGLLVFALLAAALAACGGGSSTTVVSTPGTPTGNYKVTVTGTSGNLSHTVNVPVYVE